jgi:alpha-L-fucosidase
MNKNELIKRFLGERFGMFIHWGVYSPLGGTWKGRTIEQDLSCWIMNVLQIPVKEYEQIAAKFNPVNFDAEEWVKLARDAGMRYIVFTSKHHDGFSMFHSKVDPYNIYDWTNYKRDIVAELAKACKKYDIKLGLYYSHALDWHEEHAGGWNVKPSRLRISYGNVWDYPDNEKKDFSIYFNKKVKPQVTELLTKYGDIFLMWFDTARIISPEQSEELYQLVKSLQPNCIINTRIGNARGDYVSLGDNQVPTLILDSARETPATLNNTWGYKTYDHNWKTSDELIKMLMNLSSRNINFLLNIGPMGDGKLTKQTIETLKGIGKWTSLNGEIIYNTRPIPTLSSLDWGYITSSKNKIYMCLKSNEKQTIEINGLLSKVNSIYSIKENKELAFEQSIDEGKDDTQINTLKVYVPKTNLYMPVYIIECEEEPKLEDCILQQGKSLILTTPLAKIYDGQFKYGKDIVMENHYGNYEHFGKIRLNNYGALEDWTKAEEYIEWEAKFIKAGNYQVEIITSYSGITNETRNGCKVEIILSSLNKKPNNNNKEEEQKLKTNLKEDYSYAESRTGTHNVRIGTICGDMNVCEPGIYRIRIRLTKDTNGKNIPLIILKYTLLD